MRFPSLVVLVLVVSALGVLGFLWLAAQPAVSAAGGCGGG
jgi:hypothetical protein